jgi:N-acetylglucosamine kinase-like BadF-type ATPase
MTYLLLAESGSSKTEWRLCQGATMIESLRSPGFNPNIQSEAAMRAIFQDVIQNIGYERIEKLCFYGAGLGEMSQRIVMRNILRELLPEAIIQIEHDMLAAVRSTLRPEGIVCILGTGSNSAHYANETIIQNLGGHGYIFGDEGSGAYIGKRMLKALLQKELPENIQGQFEESEKSSITEMKIAVMQSEKPNVKLATFAKVTAEVQDSPPVREIILGCFLEFLDTTVCRYDGYENLYTDFVGSIAYYFLPILSEACSKRNVKIGNVQQAPIDNLIQYHISHL